MILDLLKDRFAIVARHGNSAAYPANSARALMMAASDSDIILTDVTACKNGVLFCSDKNAVSKMSSDEADGMDIVSLREMIGWAKETDGHLLLNAKPMKREMLQRIASDVHDLGVEERVSVVTRSLGLTKYVHSLNDRIGIVGILNKPEQYAAFYKAGGHVATLASHETTPKNVRQAEAAEGRQRHPFLVLAPKAVMQDVFNACGALVGARGIIMDNPGLGRESLRRREAFTPGYSGFCPD